MNRTFTVLFFALLFLSKAVVAQQISFPGAEGAGRFTSGGRGTPASPTTVFEVTRLDDPSPTVIGTFRYAVTNNSPVALYRTVVFRVSGTIRLTSPISLNRANTTIAGQTAPGDGICIADYPVSISANNLIVRHIRFRLGDRYQAARLGNDDAFGGTGRKNIIIDHCSMSWSNDETLTIYSGDSTTVQWNMLSEPLDSSYHDEGTGVQRHAYGGIWGGTRASFHHNLIAHIRGRAPRFDGSRNLPNSSNPVIGSENADFRNNVIYNWADYNVNGGEGGNYNIVNNYYKYGPNTPSSVTSGVNRRVMVMNPYKQSAPVLPYGKYFLEGNFVESSSTVTARNWLGAAMNGGSQADTVQSKVDVPFNISPMPTETAENAYNSVLNGAGAILPKRDTLDQRIVSDVRNRTGRLINVQGGYPWGTPFATSLSAWPTLNSLPAPAETDKDGMPDDWEIRRGLDATNAADRNGYNANGYTNLENYLNSDSIVAFGINNTCIATKLLIVNGGGGWRHASDTSYAITNASDTLNAVASILNNNNLGTFNVSYYTTNTIRTINGKSYLGRNVTIEALTPAVPPVLMTWRLYISQQEYNLLKAADNTITSIADVKVVKTAGNTCVASLQGSFSVIEPTATGVFGTYGNGFFIEFQTNSLSTFFIAGPSIALPLQLVSFSGSYNGTQVSLQWRTQNEVNTSTFAIEKSEDGVNFSSLANLLAAGNAASRQYSFTDPNTLQGTNYYRLKMIDKDGRFTYSHILHFTALKKKGLLVTPNPATNYVAVAHPTAMSGAMVRIVSVDGKQLLQQQVSVGTTQTAIAVSRLPDGLYLMIYENNGQKTSQTFLKK